MSRKQKLYKKTIFKTRAVNNILRLYEDSKLTNVGNWYNEASEFAQQLSIEFDVDYLKVCGIISALSPLKSWNENKRITRLFLEFGIISHTKSQGKKAELILTNTSKDLESSILTILRGAKIKSFFLNIAYPKTSDAVTIDRHAISIAIGRSITKGEGHLTELQYDWLVGCYVEASEIAGVLPSEMQAVTWVRWRELKKAN